MNTRNQPCSCNSGKKHKKCCGSEIELKKKRDAEWEKARAERKARLEARDILLARENTGKKMPSMTYPYRFSSLAAMLALSSLSLGGRR